MIKTVTNTNGNTLHATIRTSQDIMPTTIYDGTYLIYKGGNQNYEVIYC